jgi:hypothetical protein
VTDETPLTATELVARIDQQLADIDAMAARRVASYVVEALEHLEAGQPFWAGRAEERARETCRDIRGAVAQTKALELVGHVGPLALRIQMKLAGVSSELAALLERAREAAR